MVRPNLSMLSALCLCSLETFESIFELKCGFQLLLCTNDLQVSAFPEDLKEKLDVYISFIDEERPGLLKRVRHLEQLGLTQARLSGWKEAEGDVVAILDAHIEVHVEW